jgi:MYXO-CTERM domain-containing protein
MPRALLACLLALALAPSALASPLPTPRRAVVPEHVTFRGRALLAARGELLVHFRPGTPEPDQRACLILHGARLTRVSPYAPVTLAQLPPGADLAAAAARLTADPLVLDARPNPITRGAAFDPFSAPLVDLQFQYQSRFHNVWDAWQTATGLGASVKIAVLDTGVSPIAALPRLDPGATMLGGPSAADDNGHGTLMASIIAGAGATSGVAPMATIVPVKVLDSQKLGTELALAEGLYFAASVPGVRIINMSLTFPPGYYPSRLLTDAIAHVASKSILMVGATGNDGAPRVGYPARFPDVISVGASRLTNVFGLISAAAAPYSNGGDGADIVAMGGDLSRDVDLDGRPDGIMGESVASPSAPAGVYLTSGTSPAAAQVAGALALMLDAGVIPKEALYRLQFNSTGSPVIPSVLSDRGQLNVAAMLPGRERAGFDTFDAYIPVFANVAPVFVNDFGTSRIEVHCELTDYLGAPHTTGTLLVELGGDTSEILSLSCDSAGGCSGSSSALPASAEVVTVQVLGLLDASGTIIRRPGASSRYDALTYELLSNLGAGLDAQGIIFRYRDGIWGPGMSTSARETYVMRPVGRGTANLPTVIAMRRPALEKLGFTQSALVFETRGTGLSTSPILIDPAFFHPSVASKWNAQAITVRHARAGTELASIALLKAGSSYPIDAYFRGDMPSILMMSQGTGLASSALIWNTGLMSPSLISGESTSTWPSLPPATGLAQSALVADWGPTAVGELGADWQALSAAFPSGTANFDAALAEQAVPALFIQAVVGSPPGSDAPGIVGEGTTPFSNGCEGPGGSCGGICGYVAEETCDGVDNDCDGQTDEGVANACGGCGPVPAEVCDGVDNDCEGQTDEGVANACGGCGEVSVEVCDGLDNDCDGQTDERLTNACGGCGPIPVEVCDGIDNDCDGLVDEGYSVGETCVRNVGLCQVGGVLACDPSGEATFCLVTPDVPDACYDPGTPFWADGQAPPFDEPEPDPAIDPATEPTPEGQPSAASTSPGATPPRDTPATADSDPSGCTGGGDPSTPAGLALLILLALALRRLPGLAFARGQRSSVSPPPSARRRGAAASR